MPFDPLEEVRSSLSTAKYCLERAAALLLAAGKPGMGDLRSTHVAALDVEVACAAVHSRVAFLAADAIGEPEWQRIRSEHQQAVSTATERLLPDLDDVLDPRD
jgi:hypothetical protein